MLRSSCKWICNNFWNTGGTVSVFDIRITDQDGNLDGTGTFTFYNLKKPLKID